jgi:chemotaxis signal transduction protein
MRPSEPGPVLLWRLGEALLAVELTAVEEIAGVDAAGRARTRAGDLPIEAPPGLESAARPARAVVLRPAGLGRRIALAADEVEGVMEPASPGGLPTPDWLGGLGSPHVRALIRVDDVRVAALLDTDPLFSGA